MQRQYEKQLKQAKKELKKSSKAMKKSLKHGIKAAKIINKMFDLYTDDELDISELYKVKAIEESIGKK